MDTIHSVKKDVQFVRDALSRRWMFWLCFWRIPKLLSVMCDEMEAVWAQENRIVKERDDSIKANKSLLQWVHVTHRLSTTPEAIRALFAAGKRLRIILFLCLGLNVTAAPQPSTTWVLYKWGNSGQYRPYATDGSFAFPQTGRNVAYPVFLTTTTDTSVLGDLTGRTITAQIDLDTTGNPQFRFGGQGVWNHGTTPANTRLFFSTLSAPYSNAGYTACPSCYWWSGVAWTQISATTGTVTLQDTFDPAHWSNANGQSGSSLPAEFANAVANVRQIGLAYGGGSFFDNGIAITNGTGTATFRLLEFNAQ